MRILFVERIVLTVMSFESCGRSFRCFSNGPLLHTIGKCFLLETSIEVVGTLLIYKDRNGFICLARKEIVISWTTPNELKCKDLRL